jgi:hypothetical protein
MVAGCKRERALEQARNALEPQITSCLQSDPWIATGYPQRGAHRATSYPHAPSDMGDGCAP